jgi:hypothetical protein
MIMTETIPAAIEGLFDRHPELAGFSVRGADDVPDDCPRTGNDYELFIGDIGISATLSDEQFDVMFREIVAALAEVVAEDPEADDILRGRTFARVLH